MPEVTICSHYPGDWRCGECYLCQLRKTQNVLQRELERAERAERERDELWEQIKQVEHERDKALADADEWSAAHDKKEALADKVKYQLGHAEVIIYWLSVQAMNRSQDPNNLCLDHGCISAYESALRYLLDRGIITKDQCYMEP